MSFPTIDARTPPTADGNMLAHIIERAAHAPEFDLDRLTKLLDLKERWDSAEALKAFAAAKVAFKSDPPVITKNKHVSYRSGSGVTAYDHATHDEVTTKVSEALARHGFSHSWEMQQNDDGKITVVCHLRHVSGCTESVKLSAAYDTSGGKNQIQAVASANQYLQRYTLLAVTGMSTSDIVDDDGRATSPVDVPPRPEEWAQLAEASKHGRDALAMEWRSLPTEIRQIIVAHYANDWATLKSAAIGISALHP